MVIFIYVVLRNERETAWIIKYDIPSNRYSDDRCKIHEILIETFSDISIYKASTSTVRSYTGVMWFSLLRLKILFRLMRRDK